MYKNSCFALMFVRYIELLRANVFKGTLIFIGTICRKVVANSFLRYTCGLFLNRAANKLSRAGCSCYEVLFARKSVSSLNMPCYCQDRARGYSRRTEFVLGYRYLI